MRILHFGCPYLPYGGGGTIRFKHLIEGYAGKGIKLFLATDVLSNSAQDDVPFDAVLRSKKVNSIKPQKTVVTFIRKIEPDIIVLHNSRALLAWILFYRWIFRKVRIICEIHSVRERTAVHSAINRALYSSCDEVVVLSGTMREYLSSRISKTVRISTIYNGVDVDAEGTVRRVRRVYTPSQVHFAYAGSFHDWQGVTVIAEAVRDLGREFWQQHKLTLVGGGHELNKVRSIIGSDILSLPNVLVLGWQPESEIAKIMEDVDFLLAPRRRTIATEMVVPLKVAESIKWGIPLIASRVGGLTELLDNEKGCAAVFVEPDSVADLTDKLRRGVDNKAYSDMQNLLHNCEVTTWHQSAQQYYDIFQRLTR